MKKLLTLLLLLSSLGSWSQYINVRIAPSEYPDNFSNPAWNNWKMKGVGKVNDTSQAFIDVFGNQTKVRSVITNDGTGFDNGTNYKPGQQLTLDSVIRKGIYTSDPEVLSIFGLDDSSLYSLTFIASRYQLSKDSTMFTIGSTSITVPTDTNSTKLVIFNNIAPTKGKIQIGLKGRRVYANLNGYELIGAAKKSPIKAILKIDSTIIHYPNSYVLVTDISTGKGINVNQWFMISGPKSAIFTPVGTTSSVLVSGLIPGNYKFGEIISDSLGNTDSATISTTVLAAVCQTCPPPIVCPTCPPVVICPVCPVIPPSRTITGITWTVAGGIKFTYSDGKP